MPASTARKGVTGTLMKVVWFVVGLGVLLAVLKIFNYDPFGVVGWIIDAFTNLITQISDFFTSQPWFRRLFSTPS